MKAVIKKIARGRFKGQYKFQLFAKNGEAIAQSWPESYTQKHNAIEVIRDCFTGFEIIDATKEVGEDD